VEVISRDGIFENFLLHVQMSGSRFGD